MDSSSGGRAAIKAAVAAARDAERAEKEYKESRKANFDDFFGDAGEEESTKAEYGQTGDERVGGYRKQAEYGAKKFIKP